MPRMFRGIAFWTGIFTAMFYAGGMTQLSLLFLAQTIFFLGIGYLNLSERLYMYIFGAYLTVFMVGFTYYVTFLLEPGFAH
ncbi:DUF2626 domain-containing protein [Aquisalibacillus elongatus]|uniref:Uncharacterized protein DUF2626 n=1 Tax=Aquisalibacillus elongatus TaxID=485577 RepID=A0A3N5BD97_9BACI|nr:DUF2626 domain-containing protein [Aquisalibacillus elongatus]RPF55634.1 uncharacterized protein DUF2626 [Aquisalibacillus elongatus]